MDTVKMNRPQTAAMQPPLAPLQQKPASVEVDIPALVIGGVVERDVTSEFLPGYKVRMHTLTKPERIQALKEVPNDVLEHAAAAQESMVIPTLVQAITFVEKDGISRHFEKPEDKAALRAMLQQSADIVIDVLHTEYTKMVNDLLVLMETGVKKNLP